MIKQTYTLFADDFPFKHGYNFESSISFTETNFLNILFYSDVGEHLVKLKIDSINYWVINESCDSSIIRATIILHKVKPRQDKDYEQRTACYYLPKPKIVSKSTLRVVK